MEFNTRFFHEFAEIYSKEDGPRLARTLSPDLPTEKLRKICDSQNAHDIKSVLKRGLQGNAALVGGMDHQEVLGWVEVYAAYWHAARSILAARHSGSDNQVGTLWQATASSQSLVHTLRNLQLHADPEYSNRGWCGQRCTPLGPIC